jgi:hypothetical protein
MDWSWSAYTPQSLVFTAAGAILLWGKLGQKELSVYGLHKLWTLIGLKSKWLELAELLGFVAFGVLIGIGLTHPTNAQQAFAAGLGWTGLLTTHKHKK